MLPIDHHIQNALDKFNREMKGLNQGVTIPSLAGQPSKARPDVDCPEMVDCHRNFRKGREMLKRITHKGPSKHTALNGSLTRRGPCLLRPLCPRLCQLKKKSPGFRSGPGSLITIFKHRRAARARGGDSGQRLMLPSRLRVPLGVEQAPFGLGMAPGKQA